MYRGQVTKKHEESGAEDGITELNEEGSNESSRGVDDERPKAKKAKHDMLPAPQPQEQGYWNEKLPSEQDTTRQEAAAKFGGRSTAQRRGAITGVDAIRIYLAKTNRNSRTSHRCVLVIFPTCCDVWIISFAC